MKRGFRSTVASLVEELDGFRVEIDPERERADVVLARPPLNIVRMPQREQIRLVFEELDRDADVRIVVLRAEGEHFSSGGEIPGFLERSPEHVSELGPQRGRAGALPQAGRRGRPRLLLRGRLRAVARVRLPDRVRDRRRRAPGAAASA